MAKRTVTAGMTEQERRKCQLQGRRDHYKKNRERLIAEKMAYRLTQDPEKRKRRSREYYLQNRGKLIAQKNDVKIKNPEEWARRKHEYWLKVRDKVLAQEREDRKQRNAKIGKPRTVTAGMTDEERKEYFRKLTKKTSDRWYAKNKKEKLAKDRIKHIANPEIRQAVERKRHLLHGEARKAKNRDHYIDNKEKFFARSRVRRGRKLLCPGSHTAKDILDIWERQKYKCAVPDCPYPIDGKGKDKFHVDHIKPVIRKGPNWPWNLQCLCSYHNISKSDKDEVKWCADHGITLPSQLRPVS